MKPQFYPSLFYISVIYVSQFFGLFPFSGLSLNDPQCIEFKWKSFRTLFSFCFFFCLFGIMLNQLHIQIKAGPLTPSNVVGVIFYINCFSICLFFFNLATKFKDLMVLWAEVEQKLEERTKISCDNTWTLKKQVNVISFTVLIAAAIEHSLSLAVLTTKLSYEIKVCNRTQHNLVEDFVVTHLAHLYSSISYNPFNGLIAEYVNVSTTFYWTFADVFVILVSVGLSHNYARINSKIECCQERLMPEEVWSDFRSQYNKVSELVNVVDHLLSRLLLLACFNDAYFIIVQLLNLSK